MRGRPPQSAPGALFVLVSSQAAAGPARDGRPGLRRGRTAADLLVRPLKARGRAGGAAAGRGRGSPFVRGSSTDPGIGASSSTLPDGCARMGSRSPFARPASRSLASTRLRSRSPRAAGRRDLTGTRFLSDPEPVRSASWPAIARSAAAARPARRDPDARPLRPSCGHARPLLEALRGGRALSTRTRQRRFWRGTGCAIRCPVCGKNSTLPEPSVARARSLGDLGLVPAKPRGSVGQALLKSCEYPGACPGGQLGGWG